MASKTSNYGMRLYDENDDFKITGSKDSLNHNFEIIDEEVANAKKTDSTLKEDGIAADAKTVGNAIEKLTHRTELMTEAIADKAGGAGITFSINDSGGLSVTYDDGL